MFQYDYASVITCLNCNGSKANVYKNSEFKIPVE